MHATLGGGPDPHTDVCRQVDAAVALLIAADVLERADGGALDRRGECETVGRRDPRNQEQRDEQDDGEDRCAHDFLIGHPPAVVAGAFVAVDRAASTGLSPSPRAG